MGEAAERRLGVKPETGAPDLASPVGHQQVLDSLAGAQADDARRSQESLERRLSDERLIEKLREQDFSGRLYELFETELARYAISVLRAWMYSGYVFKLLAQRRYSLNPTELELRELHDDPAVRDDLATMTVAVALDKFRTSALREGGWRVEGGASVATYFMGACLFAFPNEFRKGRVYVARHARAIDREAQVIELDAHRPTDPAAIALGEMRVCHDLRRVEDELTQAVVALTIDGYSQEEIVALIDGVPSIRAAEGRLYRWRTRQKNELDKEGRDDARA